MSKIWLSLAHMGGSEQEFVREAFETNWVVPLGPNVDGFEHDLSQWQRIATRRYTPWHYHQVRQPSTWH